MIGWRYGALVYHAAQRKCVYLLLSLFFECVVNVPSRNDAGSIKSEDQDGHLENQLATPHQQFPAVKGTPSFL